MSRGSSSDERPVTRVLLIDDNRADYLYTRALLATIGADTHELAWAADYEQGAEQLCKNAYDVYLLDYRLGDRSGLDLLRHAMASGCTRPVIVLTAYGDEETDLEAIRAGAADYLVKGEFDGRLLERSIRYSVERSQTLAALRRSEERYALAAQAANDAIWDIDVASGELYISPRWASMIGLPTERFPLQPADWLERVHPDDRKEMARLGFAHLAGESPSFEQEFRFRHTDGSYRWMLVRGLAFTERPGGPRTRMAGSVTDTTERTRAHHQLRAVLASMVEGVVAIGHEERVLHINKVAAKILDADADAAIGRPIDEVTGVAEVGQMLRNAVAQRAALRGETHLSDSGEGRVLEIRAAPLQHEMVDIGGAVVVLHDITELRRLELLRREFVANVSHELKTPLAAIVGLVETLLDDAEIPRQQLTSYLSRIREQSERLTALVSDLLTLSRAEALDASIDRSALDLRDPVSESARRLRASSEQKGQTLTVELPEAPVMIRGNDELLGQAVDNLLANAILYTPPHGLIGLKVWQSADDQALVEVRDTGIGIAPQHQRRVFERFYRVDKARSRAAGGTGLGLAIVRNIVLALDGHVSVESRVGHGTTFLLRFPLCDHGAD